MSVDLDAIVSYTTYGEYNHITEYIQTRNLQMRDLAASIQGKDELETVKAILASQCREIRYPLDFLGRPSTAHKVYLFPKYVFFVHHYTYGLPYMWRMPNQIWTSRWAFCAGSSNLMTTLLRIKGIDAWTRLGAVLDTETGQLLGFHAWTEAEVFGPHFLLEGTVHPEPPPLVPVEDAYGGALDITYDPFAIYDESFFDKDEEKLKKYSKLVKRFV